MTTAQARKNHEVIILHLHQLSDKDPLHRISFSDLHSEVLGETHMSTREFTAAIKYLVEEKLVEERAAHYTITSSGTKYADNILNPQADYTKKGYYIAYITLIVTIVGLVVGSLSSFIGSSEGTVEEQPSTQIAESIIEPSITATSAFVDVNGEWSGELFISDTFVYTISINQSGTLLRGFSSSYRQSDSSNFAVANIQGAVEQTKITLIETEVTSENPPQSSCLVQFDLEYSFTNGTSYLKGIWKGVSNSLGCTGSGPIILEKR